MDNRKRILVAPLNWGLGHATRCIPIIRELLAQNLEPVIACDGDALALLKKEFPQLCFIEFPSYKIRYAEKARYFKLKMLWDSPKIFKAISAEKKQTEQLVTSLGISGIISDNRLGVSCKKVPSVFITHQLNVLTGNTTWFSSKIHQEIIKKFDQCWVPDVAGIPNLSGRLGHLKKQNPKVKYIGALSRFNYLKNDEIYDLMVLISGPEPQRSMLESKLLQQLAHYPGEVLFVQGKIEAKQKVVQKNNILRYNYMNTTELEKAFSQSKLVLSRSGYTTVMDLAKLGKAAFFIPTPGQYEQEYLAKRLEKANLVPFCEQDKFELSMLERVAGFRGLSEVGRELNLSTFLRFFKGEREL